MSKAGALADALLKAIGSNDEQSTPSIFLTTGYPPLDHALSGSYRKGGLPAGRIVEMFGPPSCGKTAIATSVMAAAQRAGGVAGFSDHERSFHLPQGIKLGLRNDSTFVYKTPKTFEDAVSIALKAAETIRGGKYIDEKAPIVWVFDSLASMVPKSKWDKSAADYNMNDQTALARATSAVMPAFAQWCEEYNMLAIFLNQIRTKVGVVYGDPTTTPGGDAPKFYSSIRIQLGAVRIVDGKGEDQTLLGQEIRCKVIKNKVYRPFQKAKWRFMFKEDGSGHFDVVGSLLEYLSENNLIEASGPRIKFDGKSYFRKELAQKIEQEGRLEELMALLPADDAAPPAEYTPGEEESEEPVSA